MVAVKFDSALKRLQETELEILKAFASFCDEHDLEWFIDSGTVLGALRHGGFIPWDDDIDVGMLRDDYDRFLSLPRSLLSRVIQCIRQITPMALPACLRKCIRMARFSRLVRLEMQV